MTDWLSADRIRTVMAVAKHGSFSRAAAEFGVGPSSVSQQVRRLEADLGHSLFRTTRDGLVLTSDGEAYSLFARAIGALDEQARRHFAQPRAAGALHLGVAEEFTRTVMMRVLRTFKRAFPGYELTVTCDASHRLLADAEDGRYQIVVAKGPVTRVRKDLLCRIRLSWIGHEGLGTPVADPVPLVLFSEPDPFREIALRALREHGRTWRIQFQSSSLSAIDGAIAAGFGIGVNAASMPFGSGVARLDGSDGLPALPDHDLLILDASRLFPDDDGIHSMKAIIRSVFDDLPESDYPRP